MSKSIDREIKEYIDKVEEGGCIRRPDLVYLLVAIGKKMIEEEYVDKYNLFHRVVIQGNEKLDNYGEVISKEIAEAYSEKDFTTANSGGEIIGYSMESYKKARNLAWNKFKEINKKE